jgi:translation initiation factor 1
MVYSTNPDFAFEHGETPEEETLPKERQRLRVALERKGRGGKTVLVIRGFVWFGRGFEGVGQVAEIENGVGGSCEHGEILIQGDQKEKLLSLLQKEGYVDVR